MQRIFSSHHYEALREDFKSEAYTKKSGSGGWGAKKDVRKSDVAEKGPKRRSLVDRRTLGQGKGKLVVPGKRN